MERPGWLDEPVVPQDKLTDREVLIRMDGKLTAGLSSLFEANSAVTKTQADHETRIRSVEKKLWYFAGAAAVIGFLAEQYLGPILSATHK